MCRCRTLVPCFWPSPLWPRRSPPTRSKSQEPIRSGLVSVAVDAAAPTVLWQAFSEAMRGRNYVEGSTLS